MPSAVAASVSLSTPYTVLPLPSSKSKLRQCYGSGVTMLNRPSAATKSKNTEAVVAVDGEGISILDVHSTKLISTYAIPPTTKFSCDPISVRSYASSRRRKTYASISSPKRQIVCWEENSTRKSSSRPTSEISSPSSEYSTTDLNIEKFIRPGTADTEVALLYAIPHKAPAASAGVKSSLENDVLVIYRNGLFECLSSELSTQRWSSLPTKNDQGGAETTPDMLLATVMSLKVAKNTVLKKRPDVLFGYEPYPGDVAVLILSKPSAGQTSAMLKLYAVSNLSLIGNVRLLVSVSLEQTFDDGMSWDSSQLSYHALSGTLFQLSDTRLVTYDVCASIPKPTSVLNLQQDDASVSSLVRISSSNVLIASRSTISLYNTKYGALHAKVNSGSIGSSASTDDGNVRFLVFLQGAGVAIGYNSGGIVALQLTTTNRFKGDSLMDSICKGVEGGGLTQSFAIRTTLPSHEDDTNAKDRQLERLASRTLEKLSESAARNDIKRFEEVFAKYVGLELNVAGLAAQRKAWQESGSGDFDELPEFLATKKTPRALSQPFVASVLAIMFKRDIEDDNGDGEGADKRKLRLLTFAPNVLKYLLSEGYFACSNLPGGDDAGVVNALHEFDPDLNLLLFFLENAGAPAFPLSEVVRAIQLVLEKLVQPVLEDRPFEDPSSSESEPGGEETDDDMMLQKAAESAERAIERAQRLLVQNNTKESVLRVALMLANRYPRLAVVRAFREGLGGNELAGLVRILRRELLRDRDERTDDDLDDSDDDDGWLELICDLLANCLDAAGVTGLLLAKDGIAKAPSTPEDAGDPVGTLILRADEAPDAREELLLESLCSEVSDACDWLEGEHSLSLLFSDLLNRAESFRLAGLAQKPWESNRKKKYMQKGRRATGEGAQQTRRNAAETRQQPQFLRSATRGMGGRAKNALPLAYPVALAKREAGTEPMDGKMTRRAEERMKSMAMGDYTLERLDI